MSRTWRAFGLQPHRTETFKLSTDPYFIDKVHDVVGLCLDPPERALVDQEIPADLDVHLVLDNHTTHKTPAIKTWLLAHPRFHLHFTPTGSSWLNLVERWFAELTNKQIRRGVHRSVQALEEDIRAWGAAVIITAMAASVRGIVTPLIAEHVPHERELLEYLRPLDDDDITRLFTRPDSDELLSFGVVEVASLITPVVWLVVNEFVTRGAGVAADGFFARIRARFSRTPVRGADVAADPAPLTPEQQKAVYQRVYDEACLRGLEEAAAKQLGEAVVARLAMGPSRQ